MAQIAPQYALQSGYCMTGLYLGYPPVGTSSNTAANTAITNLETAIGGGWKYECYGIDYQYIYALKNVKQHIVLNVPLCAFSGATTSSLSDTVAGRNNSLFLQICNDLKTYGFNTSQMTLRIGWECTLQGFSWSVGKTDKYGHVQTSADFIAAFRYAVNYMRVTGGLSSAVTIEYNGGGVGYPDVSLAYPGDDVVDIVGHDRYANINSPYTDIVNQWANKTLPMLNTIAAFARAHNKLMGFSECGEILQSGATNRAPDSTEYWQLMQKFALDNIDIMSYIVFFNQNQGGGGSAITEYTQYFYCNITGGPTTYVNNGSTGPWTLEPSDISKPHTLALPAYLTYMAAGTMQSQVVIPPIITPTLGTYQVTRSKSRFIGLYSG